MWVTKCIIPHLKGGFLSSYAKKYQVSFVGYPIAHYEKNNAIYVTISGYINGDAKNITSISRALVKDKRVISFERSNNFIITVIKQHIINKPLFQPGIIHIKPALVDKKGDYIFEIGSWSKSLLTKVINNYKKKLDIKIIYIKQQKAPQVQTITINPSLTKRQRECLDLAINNKYYDYPRRITLKELSKLAGIAYSTYQFHLQQAEKKMMPFLHSLI